MSLIDDAYALVTTGNRSISFIVPDVVLEEKHLDRLILTDHPVETGAAITDHAFKLPVELEMRCGFSDSTAGTVGYIREAYADLITLQKSRQPFSVSTGKRLYDNMLITTLSVATDEKTENVLMITVGMREIIIVNTETTGAPASAQANPAATAPEVDTGMKQLIPSATGRAAGSV